MKPFKSLTVVCLLLFSNILNASDSLDVNQELSPEQYQLLWNRFIDSLEQTLEYENGTIKLKNIALIETPSSFKYLNAEDSEMILTDVWGNPPSSDGERSLGMLIPANDSPLSDSSFAINITYIEDGYINDEDAADIDYDDLLSTMQEDTEAGNEYRQQNGYPPIQLLGWASTPYYDSQNKKLHWAKELKFGDMESNTLNYNIRILGRKGYLQLNAIGEMYILDEVKSVIPDLLPNVNFTEGNTYADFNPDIDKVAAYGIGGLIAGKILAKAGILAKLGILLAKFWKIIVIGAIGLFAGLKKLIGYKKENESSDQNYKGAT